MSYIDNHPVVSTMGFFISNIVWQDVPRGTLPVNFVADRSGWSLTIF